MYVAIVNVPGFLPETDPAECDTAREAWEYLEEEYARHCDDEGLFVNTRVAVDFASRWTAGVVGVVHAPWPARAGQRLAYEVQLKV